METKEISVSLLIMTRLKITPDGPEELVAVLQKRGEFNHETMGPESWPGVCQLTVHGKVEHVESDKGALGRETQEELGANFVSDARVWDVIAADMTEIGRVEKPGKSIVHYATEVPAAKLASFRLNASSGGLRLVTQSDLRDIQPVPNFNCNKKDGAFARRTIAMFPDEISAVKKAFEIFSSRPRPSAEVAEEALHAENLRKMNGA
jgi:hypothetical protein